MQETVVQSLQERKRAVSEAGNVGLVRFWDGQEFIGFRGSWDALVALEGICGAFYETQLGCLCIPPSREIFQAVELIGKVESATEDYSRLRARMMTPPPELIELYPATPPGQPEPMRHQQEAFAWAIHAFQTGHTGFANWSEMGVGKSRWAVDLMRFLVKRMALVITQSICLGQWEETIESCWPEAVPMVLQGTLRERDKAIRAVGSRKETLTDEEPIVLITNWESLYRLSPAFLSLKKITALILDESARIKCKDSQMARAAMQLSRISHFKIPMSGTPMGNHPGDLWSQYQVMNPKTFGKSYWDFMDRYCMLGGHTGYQFTGMRPERMGELVQKVFACAYRCTKSTVTDIPPKLYRSVLLDSSSEQKRIYNTLQKEMFVEHTTDAGEQVSLTVNSAMARMLRLQQVTSGLLAHELDLSAEAEDRAIRGTTPVVSISSAKTDWLVAYLREMLPLGTEKYLVWVRFRAEGQSVLDCLRPLFDEDEGVALMDGQTPYSRREALRRRHNDRSHPLRVLVVQLQAGSTGLDLPTADVAIYHSTDFSYLNRVQSENRGDRLGRTVSCQIIDLVLKGTVDEYLQTVLQKKRDLSDLLVTGQIPIAGVSVIAKAGLSVNH